VLATHFTRPTTSVQRRGFPSFVSDVPPRILGAGDAPLESERLLLGRRGGDFSFALERRSSWTLKKAKEECGGAPPPFVPKRGGRPPKRAPSPDVGAVAQTHEHDYVRACEGVVKYDKHRHLAT